MSASRNELELKDTAPTAEEELETLIRARYPVIYIVSWEEERVEECLARIAKRWSKRLLCWSEVKGLHNYSDSHSSTPKVLYSGSENPSLALDIILDKAEPTIFLYKDFHSYLSEKTMERKVKEIAQAIKASPKTMVMVSSVLNVPVGLEKDIAVVYYDLPTLEEIGTLFDAVVDEVYSSGKISTKPDAATREQILLASQGLTLREAENALARTIIQRGCLTAAEVPLILNEKKQVIKKSGILEYLDEHLGLEHVGGLGNLKEWVRKRMVAFSKEASSFGLPPPKGVLLLGVQGCGKSLCARAISQVWQLPLLRLDVGRIFSSLMGSSEENIRKAIVTAESVAPALLWIDEIEKAFAGTKGADSDAGTGSRVFGTFLTWLQEKTKPVFVIATANSIASLPPELLRKGRFDEIFFVDLPTPDERAAIFSIHLRKRKRNPEDFNMASLVELSMGFSGSEIEQAIIAALYDAFDLGRDLKTSDLEKVLTLQVPLSQTLREEIEYSREWARTRARFASCSGSGML